MIGDILIQRSKKLSPRLWKMISKDVAECDGKRYKVHCPFGDKIYIKDHIFAGYHNYLEPLNANDPIEGRILSSIIIDTHCV